MTRAMTPPSDTDRTLPWEIEIRDPGSQPPTPPPRRRRGGPGARLVVLAVLGVACFVATVALLGWLLGGADQEATDQAATSTPITFAPRDQTTTTTAVPTTTTTVPTTTTSAPTTTTTAAPTTTAPSGTGSVPALSPSFGGGWVAMLTSVPVSAGTSRLEAAYAEVRAVAPGAVAAEGDDWSSLGDGYWVLVHTGHASADDVRSFCAGVESSRIDCAPRQLRRS